MKAEGYILTGLSKKKNSGHSPIILDSDYHKEKIEARTKKRDYEDFRNFNYFRASRRVLAYVAKVHAENETVVIDNFRSWPLEPGKIVVCTERDYIMAKTMKAITDRVSQALRTFDKLFGSSNNHLMNLNR